jgi:hypothetical protein
LKPEKDRSQLSFLEGSNFEYFYFVTNTELSSEKVVIAYAKRSSREKRGNAENYINTLKGHREAKYDWYAPSRSDKGYGRWASFT